MKEETAPELSKSRRVMNAQKEKGSSKNEERHKGGKEQGVSLLFREGTVGGGSGREAHPTGVRTGSPHHAGLESAQWRGKRTNPGIGKSAWRPRLESKSRTLFTTVTVMAGNRKQNLKLERKSGSTIPWALVRPSSE